MFWPSHMCIYIYINICYFLVCPNNSGGSPATNGNLDGNWYFLMWKPKNIGLGDFTRWTDPYPSWLVGMKQECTYLWKFLQFSCHHSPSSWWNMAYGRKMMEYDGISWNKLAYLFPFLSKFPSAAGWWMSHQETSARSPTPWPPSAKRRLENVELSEIMGGTPSDHPSRKRPWLSIG